MSKQIEILTDVCLITCTIQRGRSEKIIKAAQALGVHGTTVHFGQGVGAHELLGVLSVAIDKEKEIINLLVAEDMADAVFEKMYIAGKLDTPGMGSMHMTKLEKAATYIDPEALKRASE